MDFTENVTLSIPQLDRSLVFAESEGDSHGLIVEVAAIHEKECFRCKLVKNTVDHFYAHPTSKDGYGSFCKSCDSIRGKEWRVSNKERLMRKSKLRWQDPIYKEKDTARKQALYADEEYRENFLLRQTAQKHGITLEKLQSMLELQNGVCAICEEAPDTKYGRLHIDHDHNCCPGKKSCGNCIRGLLCHYCNVAIGNFKDNVDHMKLAINYLEKRV